MTATTKFIDKIDLTLDNTDKQVVIDLQGKNLIVTGANGCGKTRFLNQIFNGLSEINIHRPGGRLLEPVNMLIANREALSGSDYQYNQGYLGGQKFELLSEISDLLPFKLFSLENMFEWISERTVILQFFDASRQYAACRVGHNESVESMRQDAKKGGLTSNLSEDFEAYLVIYLTAGYMAYALRKDESEKQKVDAWLANITKDLRFLFEDDSLELEYREKEKHFYIKQQGKDPFTFNQLSSGYSAILAIYAELLMKVELTEIPAQQLSGIVIIDEIDAHLHVSLQKKILAFFDQAYPNIQFIVSTHSSLVIQSVDNAVIYDLSTLEQLEDLSMYSTDAITKGLLGTSVTSDTLQDTIKTLAGLTSQVAGNEAQIKTLIAKLKAHEQGLDSRAKVALLMAEQALFDFEFDGE